jgi:DNA invertase Pin-like site-specific DNA recombinase
MKLGYARVSSVGQSLEIQLEALQQAGCERIAQEKVTGTKLTSRNELVGLLSILRPGDSLYVTRLDRLARSVGDLIAIGKELEEKQCELIVLQQSIETKTPAGRMFFIILGAIAQFETELRAERQAEGIAAAIAAGKYKGNKRGPSYDRGVIERLHFEHGQNVGQIAKHMGANRWTIYRALEEIKEKRATTAEAVE